MKVVIAEKVAANAIQLLKDEPGWNVVTPEQLNGNLAAALPDADALIVRSAVDVNADVLRNAGKLRVIGRAGVGVDNIDLEAATKAGIAVMNTPGANAVAVAEHTLALMLALARSISRTDSTTSATRQAMASRAARATCPGLTPAVSPATTPRAPGRHQGAPTPASAGSTRTPPSSSTAAAAAASAGGSSASPRSRLSHSSSAPAVNTPPSSAHSTSPLTLHATVGSSPPPGDGRSVPAWASTNTPVPYVALTNPDRTQPAPASAAC